MSAAVVAASRRRAHRARFGRYAGLPVDVRLHEGPAMGGERHRVMTVLTNLVFVDHVTGLVWRAQPGTLWDGASVPRLFWRLFDPFIGAYRFASIVHDAACTAREAPSEVVHLMFYHAMLASGTDRLTAWLMFQAVWYFGPRFPGKPGWMLEQLRDSRFASGGSSST